MDKLKLLLKSRKFWAALMGVVMVIVRGLAPNFPISDEQMIGIVVVLVGYIIGTGLEDGLAKRGS
jgi:hypothetical protein